MTRPSVPIPKVKLPARPAVGLPTVRVPKPPRMPRVPGTDPGGLPAIPVSLARAALPVKRGARASTEIPELSSEIIGYQVPGQRLADYRELIGTRSEVPLAFPQLLATALHLDLVSSWGFPVRAMGLVHPGFVVESLAGLPADAPWDLRAWIDGDRNVRSGLEFDLRAEVSVAGEVRWRSRAVTLAKSKAAAGPDPTAAPHPELPDSWDREETLDVPADIGRRFGRFSGDINLIHLHPLTARLLGLNTAIAHGWWLLARTTAELGVDEAQPGRVVRIAFRRPIPLPSQPTLASAGTVGDQVSFALTLPGAEKPAVTGEVVG